MTTEPTSVQWCSPEIDKITGALVKAQAMFRPLIKDKTGKVTGESKKTGKAFDYSYSYADLAAALDVCREALNTNEIFVMQMPAASTRNGIEVTTRLLHSSGQWIQSDPLFMPVSGGAQDVGSAITYARRYQLLAMLGLAPEEDDDGKRAQGAAPKTWRDDHRQTEQPRPQGRQAAGLGPRCTGAAAGIARSISESLADLSGILDKPQDKVYGSALRKYIDLSKYGSKLPTPAQLTVDDGKIIKDTLAAKLGSELAKLGRQPGDDRDDWPAERGGEPGVDDIGQDIPGAGGER